MASYTYNPYAVNPATEQYYLPHEIRDAVFSYVPPNERFQTGQVSRSWRGARDPLYTQVASSQRLLDAVRSGNLDLVKLVTRRFPATTSELKLARRQTFNDALIIAAKTNNLPIVYYLMTKGARIPNETLGTLKVAPELVEYLTRVNAINEMDKPVVIGPTLLEFFRAADLGHVDPSDLTSPLLRDELPLLLGSGYGMRSSVAILLFINKSARDVEPTRYMDTTNEPAYQILANEPALYVPEEPGHVGAIRELNLDSEGRPIVDISTFDILEQRAVENPKVQAFSRDRLDPMLFPVIMIYNVFGTADAPVDDLISPDLLNAMEKEATLIHDVLNRYKTIIREKKRLARSKLSEIASLPPLPPL